MRKREGKLISLSVHVATAKHLRKKFPFNKLPFYFHVPPSEYTVSNSANHNEQQVVRRGAVSQFGGPGLTKVSFDGLLMVSDYFSRIHRENTFLLSPPKRMKFRDAHDSIRILNTIMDMGLVVNLHIQDRATGRLEFNMPITIRSFSHTEKGGEPDCRDFSIEMVQYRFLLIRNVPRGGKVPKPPARPPSKPPPRPKQTTGKLISSPYITPRKMGLLEIASLAWRDVGQYPHLITANGGHAELRKKGLLFDHTFKGGPMVAPKGMKLIIPDRPIKSPSEARLI